ncbi:hypothetical protein [Neorhizobium sp. JUb45]|uniref:hypothetical protein n=1 Tax=Neorhizobium sp. JUb45 TaxID=2485113 RepID=UPI00104E8AFF|nr:hypothetical protein [Neorhizobium sp. JUb45]
MSDWDAEKFYAEHEQSEATFIIGTLPELTDIRSWLSIVLARILHEKLAGYNFRGMVHAPEGDIDISTEQYIALLRIQERIEAERKSSEDRD